MNELPPDLPGEGAFNPALGALADDGGAFADGGGFETRVPR